MAKSITSLFRLRVITLDGFFPIFTGLRKKLCLTCSALCVYCHVVLTATLHCSQHLFCSTESNLRGFPCLHSACHTAYDAISHAYLALGLIPQRASEHIPPVNCFLHSFTKRNDSRRHLHGGILGFSVFFYLFLFAKCLPVFHDSLCTKCSVREMDIRDLDSDLLFFFPRCCTGNSFGLSFSLDCYHA